MNITFTMDHACCTWTPVVSPCNTNGSSEHFLFTYLPWLAILLHTFRKIPDRSPVFTYQAFGPAQDSPAIAAEPLLPRSMDPGH